ncbi:MAG: class I SAM-dependent methyltransferase [Pseudomonadota bacterium]
MSAKALIETGLRAAEIPLARQVKIWARFTDEKADVAASLTRTVRALHKALPLDQELRALSIGSSGEPQFRLLHALCQKGLFLFDIDEKALATVSERLDRQMVKNVFPVQGDYLQDFADRDSALATLRAKLGDAPFDLICLHHCLYYCDVEQWPAFIETLYDAVLAPTGAMHLAMMSARETEEGTTTWLYNHFARKFFGAETSHDLLRLRDQLSNSTAVSDVCLNSETKQVHFWVDDFEQYMAVIWMILLYPDGHDYDLDQRTEIVEFVIRHFWEPRRKIVQTQDYLSIFKGPPPTS